MANQVFFFTPDGRFGDADGLEFIEVDGWEQEDFEMLDNTPAYDRQAFARDIAEWIRLKRPADYWTADFHVTPKYQIPNELDEGLSI